MAIIKQPCKDCKDRWVNETNTCHSVCEKYKDWKNYEKSQKEFFKEKMKLDSDSYSTQDAISIKRRCNYSKRH